ncbi:hypothetical protein KIW84_073035 [Lathyrus oleraceus]|uniref:Reverse transcriptase zinc-binding domain-containing protein n=1 Tax=Pisum sativum TaxID=3888 RepID=A0A9D4VMT6_PEA|nr:hypothetical protein KIW84_073035 [Pisum sativum]
MVLGNSRFRRSIEDVPAKVWQTIKELGIEGEEDDGLFEGIVIDMKARDRKAFEDSMERDLMDYGDSLEASGFTKSLTCRLGDSDHTPFCSLALGWSELMMLLGDVCPTIGCIGSFIWPYGSDKSFTVESCYDRLIQVAGLMELENDLKLALSLLWQTSIPLKVKIFGWRLLLDRLPIHSNLAIRNFINNIRDKGFGGKFAR